LHAIGTTQVEVLADDLLKKGPPRQRTVKHLRKREFRLQNRQAIAVAGRTVLGRKRMWQPAQPFTEHRLDLALIQPIRQTLDPTRVFTRENPVVERLVLQAPAPELALQPLVPV